MKTDELVKMLATSAGDEKNKSRNRYLVAIGLSLLVSAVMMFSLLGLLPNLGEVIMWPNFWMKVAFSATLAGAGILSITRLARPGHPIGYAWIGVIFPITLIWVLASYTLISACPADREDLLFSETWTVCPLLIVMLSIPMLIGMLWALKDYAPTRLGLTGASCGLFSGAMGALVYTLHCPEMSAPFIGTWYLLGILITTGLGWIIGRKVLRW
jgi:hypothetical protein